jgi:hypothetical protein
VETNSVAQVGVTTVPGRQARGDQSKCHVIADPGPAGAIANPDALIASKVILGVAGDEDPMTTTVWPQHGTSVPWDWPKPQKTDKNAHFPSSLATQRLATLAP